MVKKHKIKADKTFTATKFHIVLSILLLFSMSMVLIQLFGIQNVFDSQLSLATEEARPADIELMIIADENCTDCFDISAVVDYVKGRNVKVLNSKTFSSQEGRDLIDKYSIDKIPALIVKGELDKVTLKDFTEKEDALVYAAVIPPFIDTTSMTVKGRVSTTIIVPETCELCTSLNSIIDGLKQTGVTLVEEKSFTSTENEGKNLIEQFSLEYLPVVVISKDIVDYGSELTNQLKQAGFVEKDGNFILSSNVPPYVNVKTGLVEGLISVTYLTDDSCSECYDAEEFHKPIIQRLGGIVETEVVVDASSDEGKELIAEYKITKVPTLILMGDVVKYPSLVGAWKQVGTQEADGSFIFREMAVIGQVYMDLETNTVVDPTKTQ